MAAEGPNVQWSWKCSSWFRLGGSLARRSKVRGAVVQDHLPFVGSQRNLCFEKLVMFGGREDRGPVRGHHEAFGADVPHQLRKALQERGRGWIATVAHEHGGQVEHHAAGTGGSLVDRLGIHREGLHRGLVEATAPPAVSNLNAVVAGLDQHLIDETTSLERAVVAAAAHVHQYR